jgi:hypothetical protein
LHFSDTGWSPGRVHSQLFDAPRLLGVCGYISPVEPYRKLVLPVNVESQSREESYKYKTNLLGLLCCNLDTGIHFSPTASQPSISFLNFSCTCRFIHSTDAC